MIIISSTEKYSKIIVGLSPNKKISLYFGWFIVINSEK